MHKVEHVILNEALIAQILSDASLSRRGIGERWVVGASDCRLGKFLEFLAKVRGQLVIHPDDIVERDRQNGIELSAQLHCFGNPEQQEYQLPVQLEIIETREELVEVLVAGQEADGRNSSDLVVPLEGHSRVLHLVSPGREQLNFILLPLEKVKCSVSCFGDGKRSDAVTQFLSQLLVNQNRRNVEIDSHPYRRGAEFGHFILPRVATYSAIYTITYFIVFAKYQAMRTVTNLQMTFVKKKKDVRAGNVFLSGIITWCG